jgi:hypothetical protein
MPTAPLGALPHDDESLYAIARIDDHGRVGDKPLTGRARGPASWARPECQGEGAHHAAGLLHLHLGAAPRCDPYSIFSLRLLHLLFLL